MSKRTDLMLSAITMALQTQKKEVDNLVTQYKGEKERIERKAQEMRESGKWTETGVSEFLLAELPAAAAYSVGLTTARNKAARIVLPYLDGLRQVLDEYFNAPVSANFSATLNAAQVAGLELTEREFALLDRSAKTYFERRLLANLAEKKGGAMATKRVEVTNMDAAYKTFERYRDNALRFLETYCGQEAELNDALPLGDDGRQHHNPMVTVTADAFFRNGLRETLKSVMDEIEKEEKPLSNLERELIDLIINPNILEAYPYTAKQEVREKAEKSTALKSMLMRDARYAGIVNEGA